MHVVNRVSVWQQPLQALNHIDAAFKPIIISRRQKLFKAERREREKEKAAFTSNLQSSSCLQPSFPPLHFCPPPPHFISPCNQLWLSEVCLAADFTGCKVTCLLFFHADSGPPGSRPRATCTRTMHTADFTCWTFNSSHAKASPYVTPVTGWKKNPTKNTLSLPWQKVLGRYCWEKHYIRGRGETGCFRGSEKGWWWGWTYQTEDVSDRSLNFKGASSGRKKARSSLAFIFFFFLVYAGLWETLRSTVQNNLSVFSWAVHIREARRRTRHLWVQVCVWSPPFCTLKTDQTVSSFF